MLETPVPLQQTEAEFEQLLDLYAERAPKRVLELGAGEGGTLYHWLRLAQPGTLVVAVDDRHMNRHRYPTWVPNGVELVVVTGDTGAVGTYAAVTEHAPFEFVFIDADHHDDKVRHDWSWYGRLAQPGGLVVLHDVDGHRYDSTIEVHLLWQELRATYTTREYVHGGFGIGVVEVEHERERCTATEAAAQCVLEQGHAGAHLWEDVAAFERLGSVDLSHLAEHVQTVELENCFVCRRRPATRTVTAFAGAGVTVDLCDDCQPVFREPSPR